MRRIAIVSPSIVILLGASGAGKSTFARRHFRRSEVLSSDFFRKMIAGDANDQSATNDAFEVLYTVARKRLARGLVCVVDATNVRARDRAGYVALAREFGCAAVAIILDPGLAACLERTRQRADRDIALDAVKRQHEELMQGLSTLSAEGFAETYRIGAKEDVEIVRS